MIELETKFGKNRSTAQIDETKLKKQSKKWKEEGEDRIADFWRPSKREGTIFARAPNARSCNHRNSTETHRDRFDPRGFSSLMAESFPAGSRD